MEGYEVIWAMKKMIKWQERVIMLAAIPMSLLVSMVMVSIGSGSSLFVKFESKAYKSKVWPNHIFSIFRLVFGFISY